MRLGISLSFPEPGAVSGEGYVAGMRMAERMGFDSLWFFDTIGRGFMTIDPLSAVSVAAAVTERIEIGTCILQVPLRHPVDLAHRVLTAQLFSGGRLRLGVGAGSTEADFKAVDIDFKSRFRRLKDALPEMQALWRGETVGDANLAPWPAAQGGPPIFIGSWAGSRWIPIAAKQYQGWISSAALTNAEALKEGIERYRNEGGTRALVTNIAVDLEAPTTALGDDEPFHLRCAPADAGDRLQRLADLGFDDAILVVKTVTEEYLAAVRALLPTSG